MLHRILVLGLITFQLSLPMQAKLYTTDICVYGSTSGGVVAAVQAARMGKSAVLADPGKHLGGMTSSGLGWVDFGDKTAIGGVSLEFVHRVVAYYPYLTASEWKQGPGWTFEPHAAETIFKEMLTEAKVPVHYNAELASVKKDGTKITEITMANGDIFRAKIFIDATYEGDLMAKAHVSYAITREGNAQYQETINGIRLKLPSLNGKEIRIDPYLKPGDPSSGLIPLVQSGPPGVNGNAGPEHTVQAYNYRLCLTQNPDNKIPIAPPPDYDPARYELMARFIAAAQAQNIPIHLDSEHQKSLGFLKIDPVPGQKPIPTIMAGSRPITSVAATLIPRPITPRAGRSRRRTRTTYAGSCTFSPPTHAYRGISGLRCRAGALAATNSRTPTVGLFNSTSANAGGCSAPT